MSGRIPEDFIRSLLDRADIVEYIGAQLKLNKKGKDYWACCPFHQEKTPSFSVSSQRQAYHCFGCKAGGNVIGFIMARDNVGYVEAIETLAAHYGMDVPREGGERIRPDQGIYDILAEAAACFVTWLQDAKKGVDAREYLERRRLKKDTVEQFSLGYVPAGWDNLLTKLGTDEARRELLHKAGLARRRDSDNGLYDMFRGRLMFPIRDARGRIIGFGGRTLRSDEPKYINSPQTPVFHKARELYGLFEARQASRRIESFVLVEGYTDVLALHQAGIKNGVATLGTAVGEAHFRSLFRYADEIACCFDGDTAGRAAAHAAMLQSIPALAANKRLKFAFLPEGEDPDSLVSSQGAEAFTKRLSTAGLFSEYFFEEMRTGLDLATLEDKARLRQLAEPEIERLPITPLKELMRTQLAELTGSAYTARAPAVKAQRYPPDDTHTAKRNRTIPLRQHMLSILIHYPAFFAGLEEASREALIAENGDSLSALGDYLSKNASADAATIYGFFLGTEHEQAIQQAASKQFDIASHLLANELAEGAQKLGRLQARERSRKALRSRLKGESEAR
ncbi:MAG: DNA primase [Gammaproteobacteria bacterium]|nr:DNA primase [Gammaproteobacteria bacterium]